MMNRLGDVVSRSVYGTTGYITDRRDVEALERSIVHNLPILHRFRRVVVATNFGGKDTAELMRANTQLWRRYFPECVILDSSFNRGHSIGTSDLDNMLFDYCKGNGIGWLCKSANDVYLDEEMLHIPIEPASFYFLNALSYSAIRQNEFDIAPFTTDFFFPQTTFYLIDVGATDFLIDTQLLDRSWAIVNRIPEYNGRIWEHIPRWSCELLLRICVERNNLTRHHLMTDEQWLTVVQWVIDERIEDCSFKGLSINGICHDPEWVNLPDRRR